MHHPYIDIHSDINSFLNRIDARVKIIASICLIIFIILTPPGYFLSFALYAILISGLIILSKIPPLFIFKKSLVAIPFVLMVALFVPFIKEGEILGAYSFGSLNFTVTYNGLLVFWNVLIKSYLSMLCMIILVSSTKFSVFLKALEKLRIPNLFIMILSFMYRYIFVIVDELMHMKQAKDARAIGGSRWFHTKTIANMIGTLFIRSYEKAESVYMAMCSRGFTGSIETIQPFLLKKKDIYFGKKVKCQKK